VLAGAASEPLDGWMEELYRRVSDRQTMGSVVGELRTSLGEVESALDAYFRHPDDKLPLHDVPGRLSQMRGVFSVLGMDQAAVAARRMRDSVERFLVDAADANAGEAIEKLGNSLGAMGFLIDMLSYQRELAKKLFVYDEALGEFKSLMGRLKATPEAVASDAAQPEVAQPQTPEPQPMPPSPCPNRLQHRRPWPRPWPTSQKMTMPSCAASFSKKPPRWSITAWQRWRVFAPARPIRHSKRRYGGHSIPSRAAPAWWD
jgi:chemosensory pili system protein ChpA (sensor histidine kinase/response regulator)